jgi:hypothetical protein
MKQGEVLLGILIAVEGMHKQKIIIFILTKCAFYLGLLQSAP